MRLLVDGEPGAKRSTPRRNEPGVREAWKKYGAALINLAAPDSLLENTRELAYIESGWRASLASAIYGGTTQVHRSVVAELALGMPRSR